MKYTMFVIAALSLISALDVSAQAQPAQMHPVPLEKVADVQRDIEYARIGDISLKLDLFRPRERDKGPTPIILWLHGGGWNGGSRQWLANTNIGSYIEHGYCFISIEYRLSKVAKFPAALEDCNCAVRWIRKNAAKYNFDPDKIGVMGYSSGGHLALMVGCAPDKSEFEGKGGNEGVSSRVQAVCAIAGPTDMAGFPKGSMGESAVKDLCGGTLAEIPQVYQQASPINYVAKDNPPILLIQGEQDEVVPIAQSEKMEKKLLEAGVKVQFIRIKNYNHEHAVGVQDPSDKDVQQSKLDFFDAILKALEPRK